MPPEVEVRPQTLESRMARFKESGDPEALGALFDATAPGLFRLALTLVPDPASAEDAVQETFLAAIESAHRHDPGRPVLPWLVGILHHKASKIRDRRRRTPDPHRLPPVVAPGDPARIAEDREEEERVRAALDELPEPYREVALLRWRHTTRPVASCGARADWVARVGATCPPAAPQAPTGAQFGAPPYYRIDAPVASRRGRGGSPRGPRGCGDRRGGGEPCVPPGVPRARNIPVRESPSVGPDGHPTPGV